MEEEDSNTKMTMQNNTQNHTKKKKKKSNTKPADDIIDLCGDSSSSSSSDDNCSTTSSSIKIYHRKKKKAKTAAANSSGMVVPAAAARRRHRPRGSRSAEHHRQHQQLDSFLEESSSATSSDEYDKKPSALRNNNSNSRRKRNVQQQRHPPTAAAAALLKMEADDDDDDDSSISNDNNDYKHKTSNSNRDGITKKKSDSDSSDSDVVEVVECTTKRPQRKRRPSRSSSNNTGGKRPVKQEEDDDEQMSGLSSSSSDEEDNGDDDDESADEESSSRRTKTDKPQKRTKKGKNDDDEEYEFDNDGEEESESEDDEEFMQGLEEELEAIQQQKQDGGGDGDDEDSSIASEATDPRERELHGKALDGYKRDSTRKRGKPVDDVVVSSKVRPLPVPASPQQQRDHFVQANINNPCDRNLQRLLWYLGCGYSLLSYQFLGVRRIVGVEHHEDYPQQYIDDYDDKNNDGGDEDDNEDEAEPVVDWKQVLKRTQLTTKRGCLMADVMGLGKTVQSVVASIILNAIHEAKNPKDKKPTIIVSPNDAVTQQWIETLVCAGVPTGRIFKFITKDPEQQIVGPIYVLMNRYQLQTEAKYLFQLVAGMKKSKSKTKRLSLSPLFPKVSKGLVEALQNQYMSNNGKATNKYRHGTEETCECTTRLLREASEQNDGSSPPAFRLTIIDEAHFLKNLVTFWGEGAALLCTFSSRIVPMSGTPYNNRCQDLATLMTFIDPSLPSAMEIWWRAATSAGAAASVAANVKTWNQSYLVRRDKSALGKLLKDKKISSNPVSAYPMELHVYEQYEQSFFLVLEKFTRLTNDNSPPAMLRKKQLFEQLLATFACMRMCLIHGVIPNGRDFTIQFSPTRCQLANTLSKPWFCVCCGGGNKKNNKKPTRSDISELLGDDNLVDDDDDDFIAPEDEEPEELLDKGDIVEIPLGLCHLCNTDNGLRHHAHSACLERLEECCPLCEKLVSRAQLSSGAKAMEDIKSDSEQELKPAESADDAITPKVELEIDRQIYCSDILGGFKPSAKIESIIDHLTRQIPNDEKCLVLSFFKGSLDLIEAILFYELGMDYARFDGDICPENRQKELDRFKQSPNCRFLLMTVQTGGTGLNIVEANHCIFVDRWFNPFVHEQAMDRIHRFGQKKECMVTYFDVSYSVDNVVKMLNDVKKSNATIVLADGSTSLSAVSSAVSYKDMAGLLGQAVRAVKAARVSLVKSRSSGWSERLPCLPESFDFEPADNSLGFLRTLRAPRGQPQETPLLNVFAQLLGLRATDENDNQNKGSNNPAPRRVTPELAASSAVAAAAAASTNSNGNNNQGKTRSDSDSDDDSSFNRLVATPYLNPKAGGGGKKSGTGSGNSSGAVVPRVVRFSSTKKTSKAMPSSVADAASNNPKARNESLLPDRAASSGSAFSQPASTRHPTIDGLHDDDDNDASFDELLGSKSSSNTKKTKIDGLDDEDDDASFERLLGSKSSSKNNKKKNRSTYDGKSSTAASRRNAGRHGQQKAAAQPLCIDLDDSSSTSS